MAPEYLLTGEYSEKSDVYSFGIMVLEIVSGQRCRPFNQSLKKEDLLVHAWKLWIEDRSFELTDSRLCSSSSTNEVLRCIQIGLLCVQGNPVHRPTMAAVVLMLTGSVTLPLPSAPMMAAIDTYTTDGSSLELDQCMTNFTCSNIEAGQDLYQNKHSFLMVSE